MHVSATWSGRNGTNHEKYLAVKGKVQNKKWRAENENCRIKRQLKSGGEAAVLVEQRVAKADRGALFFFAHHQQIIGKGFHNHHGNLLFALLHKAGELAKG